MVLTDELWGNIVPLNPGTTAPSIWLWLIPAIHKPRESYNILIINPEIVIETAAL
jgi:hypothetical protein